jgi:hypothetical protein
VSVITIVRLIGLLCWLWHQSSHTKVCDGWDAESGRWNESWMCRECGKTWEVTR